MKINTWQTYRLQEHDESKHNHHRVYQYKYDTRYFQQWYIGRNFSKSLVKRWINYSVVDEGEI